MQILNSCREDWKKKQLNCQLTSRLKILFVGCKSTLIKKIYNHYFINYTVYLGTDINFVVKYTTLEHCGL